MPTLAVVRDYLFRLLGQHYTDNQFEDICFKFGIELDEITNEQEIYRREQGQQAGEKTEASDEGKNLSSDVIYKIETPANRYDLLSCEGLTTALKVFLGTAPLPQWRVLNQKDPLYHMLVKKSVKNVRDYVVCAVLRNIRFDQHSYNSFIELQEKLHSGLARRRTLASVGTHDLDKIKCNTFIYEAAPKNQLQFVPLRQTTVLDCSGDGLENYYKNDRHIRKYVPIIATMPNYPVIRERNHNTILSLPPIINSHFSAVSKNTRNVFIECTAPDHYRARILVNQLVGAFSIYCEDQFTVEAVMVEYEEETPDGTRTEVTPVLESKEIDMSVSRLNSIIGVNMKSGEECALLLRKMMYDIMSVSNENVRVKVSPMRNDILGSADVMEDVAIAYGYDNIEYKECTTRGLVTQTPLSKVSHLLRIEMASAGYTEILTFSLCSRDEAFAHLGRVDDDIAVHIANPQTLEFQICRPSLAPGMLKTLSTNKSHALPLKFFEIADVVLIDNEHNFPHALDTINNDNKVKYPSPGARNQRHIAALHCASNTSSLEQILALTKYIMIKLGVPSKQEDTPAQKQLTYTLEPGVEKMYFPGRAMDVYINLNDLRIKVGSLGTLHPDTLKKYDIPHPCSYLEMNIQYLCL